MDRVRDVIQHQFGLEILCKHNELRLIDQEIAKCQVALEQLRRCHLMPYPVNIPTPEQMLGISSGKGPAVALAGHDMAPWAPPYGVTDGPYARHYAKWLIPDPAFDGHEAAPKMVPESQPRGSVPEGRATRKGLADSGNLTRGRHARGQPGQKHQALPYSYPAPKDKAGPCTLKRASDGRTVKLACLDCHRENFSSTQGFINHCRIAHKRDFKSHEEAAIACGHPIDTPSGADRGRADERPATTGTTKRTVTSLHPFARHDMTDQEAYKALRSRISASMELYKQGKLPGVTEIPSSSHDTGHGDAPKFEPSAETPYLSQFLRRRNFRGNLQKTVANAKIKIPVEDTLLDEEPDEAGSLDPSPDAAGRPAVMTRVPARCAKLPPAPAGSITCPPGNKGRAPLSSPSADVPLMYSDKLNGALSDEDLDMEDANLSPGIIVSNIAPSLVSDDGEYDSDEGYSVSGASDSLEGDSVSDVAEISLDDEHDSRALRRSSNGMVSPVKLRRDDSKHVTLMSTVRGTTTKGRPRNS
ncbi:hypothetical protein ESCO_006235 [Escovopsis weberi]|uniref:AHC1-like C2H2 zinc-finger domain-containing protein n=1 Tax=Escovopsis weberi TaxID=150374 RepID=A0A0M9VV07_ESCWE|nr:hypothetical protein ESCO_006235 [Escovopsis weberi]